jgi:hypothetical protein
VPDLTSSDQISRRRALALGGGLAATSLLVAADPRPAIAATAAATTKNGLLTQKGKLPAHQIQDIVGAEGTVSHGVLGIEIERTDIGNVAGPLGVTFTPSFEVNGTLTFQPLGHNLAFFNGDLPVLPSETNGFIDALIANGLVFQAFHQHYTDTTPNVWFIHFRGLARPLSLARAVHNALKATATPLPQKMPSNPTSPLDHKRLGSILRGDAQVGDAGSVTVTVGRSDKIVIGGVEVSPEANIYTEVQFSPLTAPGQAAVGPDFSMISSEVQSVMRVMRRAGWFVGCLYNQETGESPQLYFSHMLKTGDAYSLAGEIRRGLDRTNSQ